MKKLTVYLGGDIIGEEWRGEVVRYLGNLANHVRFLSPRHTIKDVDERIGPDRYTTEFVFFDTIDLMKIDASQILFFFIRDSGSVFSGTSFEIGYGKAKGKTIILVNAITDGVKKMLYEMIQKQASYFAQSLAAGCWMLEAIVRGYVTNYKDGGDGKA